jgi:6-pyruvoyl-tetrahydropterin synthase
MFSLTVRDHFMIAHSLRGEVFGPARSLHGATYIVDAEFRRPALDPDNLVIDIGLALRILGEVLSGLNYKNLDEVEAFAARPTTTEFLARHIHGQIAGRVASFFEGGLKVTLHESHIAWAGYEADVP